MALPLRHFLLLSLPPGKEFGRGILRRCISLVGSSLIPRDGLRIVFGEATFTILICHAKKVLRICISLLSGFLIPRDSLSIVFRQTTLPVLVRHAKTILCSCVSLLSGFLIPRDSLSIVFRQTTLPVLVRHAKIELRLCISLPAVPAPTPRANFRLADDTTGDASHASQMAV